MKFTHSKRLASMVMAGALAVSMAAPAFAADDTTNRSVAITGAYADVPIDVVVPTTGTVVVNPYGLPIELTKSDSTKVNLTGQQITTRPMAIKNQSELDLGASVTATATAAGNLKFVAATNVGSTTAGNNAFVYLQSQPLDIATGTTNMTTLAADTNAVTDAITDAFVTWAADGATYNAESDLIITDKTGGAKKDNMFTLAAAEKVAADATATPAVVAHVKYNTESIALIRLAGDLSPVVKTPWSAGRAASADDPAVPADGFTVNLVFTFAPVAG